jgi:hypothetical protein
MDIDLNLNNYSVQDLIQLFCVSPTFTILEVDQQKQVLLDRLIQINVNPQMQKEIVTFLNSAKDVLVKQMELIPKQTTPFIYSNPSNYFQGTFNPIEKRLITKTVCIDTLFRSNYENSNATDFTYTFPETINNVVSMQIKCIEIPYSWYTISTYKKNNKFSIIVNGSTPIVITIPDGNYNTIPYSSPPSGFVPNPDIITIINSQIPSGVMKCSYNAASNRIVFTWPTGSPTPYTIDFTQDGTMISSTSTDGVSLGCILGFKYDIYTDETEYIAESTYKTSFNNYFFIDVDDFHNNHLTDAVISVIRTSKIGSPSYIGNNIMARIPVNAGYNSIITNSSIDSILNKRDYFGPVKLERMNIRLLDRFGKVIDLNNNDYSLVFEVIQLYS